MKLLKPGTGNQRSNRDKAIDYISKNIFDVAETDLKNGNITTGSGDRYHVSAYAETGAAFVSTPGVDKSFNSIYASGLPSLLFRQIKGDKRSMIYEVNPDEVVTKPGSSTAEWPDIDRVAQKVWVCTESGVRCFDRTEK